MALADHDAPFGKAAPAGLPAQQPPDGFGEQAAQAAVALAVDLAEELALAAGAVFAWGAADEAADFLAVAKALPVHDFEAGGQGGELAEAVWQRHGEGLCGHGGEPVIEFEDLRVDGLGHGPLRFERFAQLCPRRRR